MPICCGLLVDGAPQLQVLDDGGREVWRSPSSVDLTLTSEETVGLYTNLEPGTDRFRRMDLHQYFFLSYKVLWLGSGKTPARYTVAVVVKVEITTGLLTGRKNVVQWAYRIGWVGDL